MSFIKIKNLEDQLAKIKMFLPVYLEEKLKIDMSSGKKILCLSPEHDDRSPSMSLFRSKDMNTPLLKCHSCGVVMDIFNACHVIEHRPLVGPGFIDDTVSYLASKYEIEMEIAKMSEDDIYEMNIVNMNKNIHEYICHQEFNVDQLYELDKRNWDPAFANKIGIGACHDLDHMKQYLKSIGYSFKFMEENDLDHTRVFNSSSLIFTIFDEHGRPVAFAARNLNYDGIKDDVGRFINGTKFINTKVNPRCGIGKKSEMLYLFHIAKNKTAPIYVFEGNADTVTAHNNNIFNSVAICGLGLNENHLNMFRRHGVYDIVVCLDSDDAGMLKAKQILDDALKKVHDIKIRFVFLPDRKIINEDGSVATAKFDPDEFIRQNGAEAFLRLPKVDPFAWRLQQFDSDQDADSESICLSMIPIIASDPSSIKREGMIRDLSEYTGMPDKAIREEVGKIINADEIRIEKAKKSIMDEVVNQLSAGQTSGIESILSSALDRIQTVEKEFKTGTFDVSNRVTNLLGIKQYQEAEDAHIEYNFGDEYRIFNNALNGDLKQKLILLGASANVGKSSMFVNLSWNLANLNDNVISIYLTIDDSAKEILPRIICYDMVKRAYHSNRELFDLLNINKIARPYLYKDSIEYDSLVMEREISYKRLFSLSDKDKYVLLDSEDGKTLEFIQSLVKHYTERYPEKHVFLFLDNIHLVSVPQYEEGRMKYKYLSHELKSLCVKHNITLIGTVEYRKLPVGVKPSNADIAEANSFEYDANAIIHMYSELHSKRDESNLFHWSSDYSMKIPVVEAYFGKNKISSFKGNLWLKSWPDKAYFTEMTDQAMRDLVSANEQSRLEYIPQEVED